MCGRMERGKRTPDSVAAVGAGRSTLFSGEQGFSILREAMLTDEGKYYIVIEAARGTMRPGREQDYRLSRFDPEERSGAACVSGERREDDAAGAGRADENDAQNKKETLEASEGGRDGDQPPSSAHQRN